jgi:hypothetical protein
MRETEKERIKNQEKDVIESLSRRVVGLIAWGMAQGAWGKMVELVHD